MFPLGQSLLRLCYDSLCRLFLEKGSVKRPEVKPAVKALPVCEPWHVCGANFRVRLVPTSAQASGGTAPFSPAWDAELADLPW